MKRIEGKVAEVISDRDLVINRGSIDGVEIGMRFRILHSRGAEIKDPDTKEVLGRVEVDKTIVKITSVDHRLAVGRTFRTFKEKGGALYQSMLVADAFRQPKVTVETLNTGGKFAKSDLSPEKSYVKIGDRAVQYLSDDSGAEIISYDE